MTERALSRRAELHAPSLVAEVLVPAEATIDSDANVEQRVQDGSSSTNRDDTIVAIAHRPSTIENTHWNYAIEDGTRAEDGEHQHRISNDDASATLYSER